MFTRRRSCTKYFIVKGFLARSVLEYELGRPKFSMEFPLWWPKNLIIRIIVKVAQCLA